MPPVKAVNMVIILQSKGSFTLFALSNDALIKLPASDVYNLLKRQNKTVIAGKLIDHIVADNLDTKTVLAFYIFKYKLKNPLSPLH